MSYYIVNEKTLALPDNFNGVAVFYFKEKEESRQDEQKVLFQRLFENGLNMKLADILWMEIEPGSPSFTFKNKEAVNCALFFGVNPSQAGFHLNFPANKFAPINNIQLLYTGSPKELNEKPEMKKILWAALQVLK